MRSYRRAAAPYFSSELPSALRFSLPSPSCRSRDCPKRRGYRLRKPPSAPVPPAPYCGERGCLSGNSFGGPTFRGKLRTLAFLRFRTLCGFAAVLRLRFCVQLLDQGILRRNELGGVFRCSAIHQCQMQLTILLQLRQYLCLLSGHQQCHGGGKFLFIHRFAGIGIVSGGGSHRDDLHILQLRRNGCFTLALIVRHDDRDDIAALQLTGKAGGKALDGNGDGLLCAVQIIEIGILCRRGRRKLTGKDIVSRCQIRSCVLADDLFLVCHEILRQIICADLYRLDHLGGDLVTFLDVLRHTDDLRFFTGAAAEQRRNTEADDQRQQDTQHTDDGAIAKNLQIVFLLIENMRE